MTRQQIETEINKYVQQRRPVRRVEIELSPTVQEQVQRALAGDTLAPVVPLPRFLRA